MHLLLCVLLLGTSSAYTRGGPMFARRKNRQFLFDEHDDYYEETERQEIKDPMLSDIFEPKTTTQRAYYDMVRDDEIKLVIASGPAGTGKTLFPTQHAAKVLMEPGMKVIVTRPLICVDEELGYLPGGINQKMDPWTIPIFDVLREFFTQNMIDKFIAEKKLEVVPLAFMRGRTFKNAFIIGDELQNTSINQMLMLLTRIGENSKMVITGDVNQCDHTENGLLDLMQRLESFRGSDQIGMVEMTAADVQRSELVGLVLEIYGKG